MKTAIFLVLAATVACVQPLHPASAQELIVNPVRGGGIETNNTPMIHADIRLDSGTKQLTATVDAGPGKPRLRALPEGYSFDLNSKYRVLSGKSYNFQYAWNPGGIISLPANSAIWIEALGSSPGLEVYDGPGNKMENPPRTHAPIFGTSGSSRMWKWYGRMAHNTYAIRNPVTNLITAEYRLFIGDAQTGDRSSFSEYNDTTVVLSWDIDEPVLVTPYMAGGRAEGDMIHIDVVYDENARKVVTHVDGSQGVPELRPLPPGMAFDQQKAFSILNQKHHNSQYGWNIGAAFGIPAGTAFWVEAIGSSPGLEVYEANGAGGSYKPILGTAGSPVRWKWSGSMMHNTFAVLNPGLDKYVAEYAVYLGDATTGSREGFSDIAESRVKLAWTASLSSFAPELRIRKLLCQTGCVTAEFQGEFGRTFHLEAKPLSNTTGQWLRVAGPLPGVNAPQHLMDMAPAADASFYRLVSEAAW